MPESLPLTLPFYFPGTLVNRGGFLKCPVVRAQLRSLRFPPFLFLVRAGHQGDSCAGSRGRGAAVRLQLPPVAVTASQTPLHGTGSPTCSWLLLLLGQVCVQLPQDTDAPRIGHKDGLGCHPARGPSSSLRAPARSSLSVHSLSSFQLFICPPPPTPEPSSRLHGQTGMRRLDRDCFAGSPCDGSDLTTPRKRTLRARLLAFAP